MVCWDQVIEVGIILLGLGIVDISGPLNDNRD